MIKKTIYLIRHGETDLNRHSIIQGQGKDPSLNAHGRCQARAFFQAYKKVSFDAIYTSTLKRSIESVQLFIDSGIAHHALLGLNEIDWGVQEGKKIVPEREGQYYELVKKWKQGEINLCVEGGESPAQVAIRQREAIQIMLKKHEEKHVLVCMHGRAMRILLCQLLHRPLSEMDKFIHANLSLYVLHYTGAVCHVAKFNDTTHLSDLY